ncbi:hypothetical protein KP509_38G019500 [Ceratopteris richardii]|uniref:tRNA pseudouridine(55) synthase n=1 Tax=Ceratopteris richardii TaxID=49495 RepID=A0A8T2Q2Z5_CERRI|nr:hypothetical protein KP509_38G019500 [Ceratopteris richardii]
MESTMYGAIQALPSEPVSDLLSIGVCPFCILRFFGIRDVVYSYPFLPSTLVECTTINLSKEPCNKKEQESFGHSNEQALDGRTCNNVSVNFDMSNPCIACLGIFQLEPGIDRQLDRICHERRERMAVTSKEKIIESVKKEGYQFDTFTVEISIPGIVMVRERAVWQHLQEKHGSQSRLQGKHLSEHVVSSKEALKGALIKSLEESLQAVHDSGSTFKIALRYKHPETVCELGFPGCSLKRKRGVMNEVNGDFTEPVESLVAIQRCLASISAKDFASIYPYPPPKCAVACNLDVSCYRTATLIGGRYLKFSRNISQSPWMIEEERKGDGSVQEIIADVVFPHFKADSYKFHASGREDIDVRMLGGGRPFMMEIVNARVLVSPDDIQKIEDSVNSLKEGWVKVRNLQLVGADARSSMLEGETEKQKQYTAVIWLSRCISNDEINDFMALKDLQIQQKTPVRVLHRRSPLVRPRMIHWLKLDRIEGTEHYYLLHLCSQAGTYIKEFVHGDLGRTYPNMACGGSLVGAFLARNLKITP